MEEMNPRRAQFVNLLDLDRDDRVTFGDALRAFDMVDAKVSPHGWGWTVCIVVASFMLGYFLKGLVC